MNQRCFPLPEASITEPDNHPVRHWLERHPDLSVGLSALQQTALARLVPLLLCGEQSAIHVFHTEYSRREDSQFYLAQIEADERLHEIALQRLLQQVPEYENLHRLKRQAQLFYARIQQASDSVARHFYTISQLDACVCVLMNAVANSSIKGTAAAGLFSLIKRDEARHVSIARRHALRLQQDIYEQPPLDFCIHQGLVSLLQQQTAAFEMLGIDADALFQRLVQMAPVSGSAIKGAA
ncbi:hypothetical protein [Aliamphritea hakodatensis]|uniref:hypothetical protein n=1 Tax=Aliamphritea hakodatensis TaxID=2895352 RepID=UPI0022FD5091|nr:hypothetical protein [Aliamphritea hakodatensis]